MSKSIFVTGAGGFVGANLVRALLEQGSDVHAMIRPNGQKWRLQGLESPQLIIHEVDITDATAVCKLIETIQPTIVYHLSHYGGNRSENDDARIRQVIIGGTVNLYQACLAAAGVEAIVHTGSSSEYGAKDVAMREDMVLEPNTEYGLAKAWATLYGQHLAREQGLPVIMLRLFSVYGPFEAGIRLMPAVILSCINNQIPQLSNPNSKRDFVYISDVVAALQSAATKASQLKGEIINIGTGIQSTIKDAVDTIVLETKVSNQLEWGKVAGRSFDSSTPWVADITKARKLLQWQPVVTLADGICLTVQWFNKNHELY